MNQGCQVNQHK